MRILGKSGSNKNKHIIEVSEYELELIKHHMELDQGCYNHFETQRESNNELNSRSEDKVSDEQKADTSDMILDNYNDKKISKNAMINALKTLNEMRK